MTKHWTVLITVSLATLLALFAPAEVARADIFEWEYINPANPALGKQQSTLLAPDGAGANAEPGTNLSNRNLTMGYLIGANVSTYFVYSEYGFVVSYVASNLTAANLSQADLTNANFQGGYGYNENEQLTLYPSADLTDANLSQANATNVNFNFATLTGANLSQADLTNANLFLASLTNANLSQANLTNAFLHNATLAGANLTGAEVRGANLAYTGLTAAQLSSTASYQAHDLTRITLIFNDLTGADLANQNLTNADFRYATLSNANFSQANLTIANFFQAALTGANLSQANLTNAIFAGHESCDEYGCGTSPGADLTNANLSAADARGANFEYATLSGANTNNLIQSNGHIAGLDLTAGASLVVRDYDGNPIASPPTGPLPVVVDQHLAMSATGALRLEFDADPWDSTISFAPGISVARGGTLELAFAPDVNLASQLGRTIDLFDWTGVTPIGAFTVSSPYTWNLTNLYTTGEVTLTAVPSLPGDFNLDGAVDAADYVVWRKGLGTTYTQNDYNTWQANFGASLGTGSGATGFASAPAAPEPASLAILLLSVACLYTIPHRRVAAKIRC